MAKGAILAERAKPSPRKENWVGAGDRDRTGVLSLKMLTSPTVRPLGASKNEEELRIKGILILASCESPVVQRKSPLIHWAILFRGPPGSRSRHLGIKSPLLFPMS